MATVEGALQQPQQFGIPVPLHLPVMDSPSSSGPSCSGSRMFGPMEQQERPQSALARGIQITEYKDNRVNPDPIILEESEILLEEFLSPRKLRDLTGVDDLEDVRFLEMKVDTRDTSLGNFGFHLPHLSQLKLSNSIIASMRDLGSSFNNLTVLWMARCGLEELGGLSAMNNLRELYLAYNEIQDISPCSILESMQILDLEGNNIDEISQIEFLALCSSLINLTLEGNPICLMPSPDATVSDYNYRQSVKKCVPHLKYLDDELLVEEDLMNRTSTSAFDADWKLLDELMQEGVSFGSDDSIEMTGPVRPGTARPTTTYRPGSALKPYTPSGIRPGTSKLRPPKTGSGVHPGSGGHSGSMGRPGSAIRPGTASARPGTALSTGSTEEIEVEDDSSELTRGLVVCGNPSKALRLRQKGESSSYKSASRLLAQMKHKPEHTYDLALEDDDNLKTLFQELKQFKLEHEKKNEEIAASKAPQVLTIDHDDVVSVSDDESDSLMSEEEEEGAERREGDRMSAFSRSRDEEIAGKHSDASFTGAKPRPPSVAKHGKHRPQAPAEMSPPVSSNSRGPRKLRLYHDESFEARDDASPTSPLHNSSPAKTPESADRRIRGGDADTSPYGSRSSKGKSNSMDGLRSPSPFVLRPDEEELRPVSNPVIPNKSKFRLSPVVDKTQPKFIDKANPVIRASPHSPEKRVPDGPRAGTSRAALGQPSPSQLTRIRKGQLANVQLLPSKFTK